MSSTAKRCFSIAPERRQGPGVRTEGTPLFQRFPWSVYRRHPRLVLLVLLVFVVPGGVEAAILSWNGWEHMVVLRAGLAGALFLLPVGVLFLLIVPIGARIGDTLFSGALPKGASMGSLFGSRGSEPASRMARWWALFPSLYFCWWLNTQLFLVLDGAQNRPLAAALMGGAVLMTWGLSFLFFAGLAASIRLIYRRLAPWGWLSPSVRQRRLAVVSVTGSLLLGAGLGAIILNRYSDHIHATAWEPFAMWGAVLTLGVVISAAGGLFNWKDRSSGSSSPAPRPAAGRAQRLWRRHPLASSLLVALGVSVVWYASLDFLVVPQSVRLPLLNRARLSSVVFRTIHTITDFDRDGSSHLLGGGDCAPFNPDIHPGAREIPGDGIDNNCIAGDADPDAFDFHSTTPPVLPEGIAQRPHIILLTVDALRYDRLGAADLYHRRVTPNLDRLAQDGVLYRVAYAHTPATRWMIPLIMTGQYPSQIEWDFSTWFHSVLPEENTLPDSLAKAGYRTEAIWTYRSHMGLDRAFHNFDHSLQKARPGSHKVTDRAIEIIDRHRRDYPERPLFLWAHYFDPHHPYRLREGFDFGGSDRDRYDSEVAAVDHDIGRLLDHLKAQGIYQETAILVTADHGEAFGEHGKRFHSGTLYDGMVRIPMILRVPGLEPGTSNVPTGLIDVAPTLLSLVPEFEGWDQLMGHSLLDKERPGDLPVFGTLDFLRDYRAPERMMIPPPGQYKLIVNFNNGLIEYYDLEDDPGERRNLADRRREEIEEMLPMLEAWFEWVVMDGTL